jgi:aminoglycoside phosphotransferase (APT) family kinase protein
MPGIAFLSVRIPVDADLVARLVASQFPQWAEVPVRPVDLGGWDNTTFRLGGSMSVRLPSAEAYVAQIAKEHEWLPRLAPHLPLPIPVPIARGRSGDGYPWPWSVYRWLPGEPAETAGVADFDEFARSLGEFLLALQRVDVTGGPAAGPHNFYRGGPLTVYDDETRRAIDVLRARIDVPLVTEVWEAALATQWSRPPVWVHGDVATGNLLVTDGHLSAVIDFGSSGVGDPACDTVIAWTLLSDSSRAVFREVLGGDEGLWARGRGWALWKSLITIAGDPEPRHATGAERTMREVLADHRTSG